MPAAMNIGPMDVFWVFIMLSSLQPMMKQRWLEASGRRLIDRIERKRGSRVILLAHRQETMSFLGFPLMRYIDVNDSEEVIRAIRLTDPSVAADEIILSDHAVLGPVDPQLVQYPAASLLKAVEQKSKDRILDETLILADQAKKAITQVQETVRELLRGKYPDPVVENLAVTLSEGRWTHDFPITFDYAKALGLHVSSEMPPEILDLMMLYPQPVRRFPSVEYLPGRREAGRRIELGESSGEL